MSEVLTQLLALKQAAAAAAGSGGQAARGGQVTRCVWGWWGGGGERGANMGRREVPRCEWRPAEVLSCKGRSCGCPVLRLPPFLPHAHTHTCRSAHLLAMLDRGMLKLVKTQILVLESHPW